MAVVMSLRVTSGLLGCLAAGCIFSPPNVDLTQSFALDGGARDSGSTVEPAPMDATTVDYGTTVGYPDARPPPDLGTPDAGFEPDADPPDTGIPPTPCDLVYGSAALMPGLRLRAAADTSDMRAGHVSADLRTVYASLLRPRMAAPGERNFEVWVFTRAGPTAPFDNGLPTTLDLIGPSSNDSSEVDIEYVPTLERFWFTQHRGQYQWVTSAELRVPTDPSDFWTFNNEVGGLPEPVRNYAYRGATLSDDGLLLVLSRQDPNTGKWNLVEHRRGQAGAMWGVGTRLGPLSSAADELDGHLSADGLRILFASNRGGDFDLYCSWRPDLLSTWATPTTLPPPPPDERAPHVVGDHLVFSRKSAGPEDVYLATP